MKVRTILSVLMLLPLFCSIAVPARAQTGNDDFQQAVTAYQQSPNDLNKAEKVIRMAAAMDQLPPIPEEARRHFVRGTALFKDAKSPDDYKQVIDEFTQAVHLAPWWPDARYNYALALDAAGEYAHAIAALKLYLLFKLPDSDARATQDKIYVLEAKQEKAAKAKEEENSPQAAAAREQKSFEDLLSRMDGRRYTGSDSLCYVNVLDIKGRSFVPGQIGHPNCPTVHQGYNGGGVPFEIQGRVTSHTDVADIAVLEFTYTINENGNSITVHTKETVTSGPWTGHVYDWDEVYH
jgi:hypothetical protein